MRDVKLLCVDEHCSPGTISSAEMRSAQKLLFSGTIRNSISSLREWDLDRAWRFRDAIAAGLAPRPLLRLERIVDCLSTCGVSLSFMTKSRTNVSFT